MTIEVCYENDHYAVEVDKINTTDNPYLIRNKEYGVIEERVLASINRTSSSDVDIKDIEKLIGVANALREREIEIDTAFPPTRKQPVEEYMPIGNGENSHSIEPEEKLPHDTVTGEILPHDAVIKELKDDELNGPGW